MRLTSVVAVIGVMMGGVDAGGQNLDVTLGSASVSRIPKVLAATQAPLGVESSDAGGESPTPTTQSDQPDQTAQKVFTLTTLTTPPPVDIKSSPVPGFSFPPGTVYETATQVISVTSGLMPMPTGVDAGTRTVFPGANSWWTMGAEAVAQWSPALPVLVNIELYNMDTSLLRYTYRLASSVAPGTSSRTFVTAYPASPGSGYVLHIKDAGNGTVYSVSEPFEIKKEGSQIMLPAGYSSSASMGSSSNQRSSASRITTSRSLPRLMSLSILTLGWTLCSSVLSMSWL